MHDVPVLIVGAGPVGLAGAILAARQGLDCRIIDRREAPTTAPAAHVVNARTFEICRAAGVDMAALAEFSSDPADAGQAIWVTNLAGEELGRLPFERQDDEVLRFTPTPLRNLAQHRFEKVLRDTLPAAGGPAVEYGLQWESAVDDGDTVVSRVRDLATGEVHEIRSRWLIACDGAGSPIRRSVGIEMEGPKEIQSFVMIHFGADLRELVEDRPGVLYWLTEPDLGPTFVAHDIESEWVYMYPFDPTTETEADYPPERCAELVTAAIGTDDYPVTIQNVGTWMMSSQIADRYREGRVFLAGDAAHRFPPTGGLGLNSGVQDVHGLMWRIAGVEAGWADPAVLDSYETERRPVARANAENSLANAVRLFEIPAALGYDEERSAERLEAALADPEARAGVEAAIANQAEHFDTLGLQLGYRYDRGAVVADGSAPPEVDNPVREFAATGRPGARMPHAWIERGGERISTLDLLPVDGFSLVTTEPSPEWETAVAAIADVPVTVVSLGAGSLEDEARWREESGIGTDGALLVRPDQHVAWRAAALPADASATLAAVVAQLVVSPASRPRLRMGHSTLLARDLDRLVAFYTDVLGFEVTNRGEVGDGAELAFLSQDPDEHHQIAMVGGTPAPDPAFMMVDHLAFRTGTLDDLRALRPRLMAAGVVDVMPICHGNAWSLYFTDPEGNGVEVFVDTPFHVAQPYANVWDPDSTDEEVHAALRTMVENEPEFAAMDDWREAFVDRLARR